MSFGTVSLTGGIEGNARILRCEFLVGQPAKADEARKWKRWLEPGAIVTALNFSAGAEAGSATITLGPRSLADNVPPIEFAMSRARAATLPKWSRVIITEPGAEGPEAVFVGNLVEPAL